MDLTTKIIEDMGLAIFVGLATGSMGILSVGRKSVFFLLLFGCIILGGYFSYDDYTHTSTNSAQDVIYSPVNLKK